MQPVRLLHGPANPYASPQGQPYPFLGGQLGTQQDAHINAPLRALEPPAHPAPAGGLLMAEHNRAMGRPLLGQLLGHVVGGIHRPWGHQRHLGLHVGQHGFPAQHPAIRRQHISPVGGALDAMAILPELLHGLPYRRAGYPRRLGQRLPGNSRPPVFLQYGKDPRLGVHLVNISSTWGRSRRLSQAAAKIFNPSPGRKGNTQ